MGWIRRRWSSEAAEEWTREDYIAMLLSVISYLAIAVGTPLAFFSLWGWLVLGVGAAALLLMIFIIDPKLKAVSSGYEKQQQRYIEELEKNIRWED